MKFRIDLKIFLFVVLFYFTKQVEMYAMIMFFAMVHEFGHLLIGLLLGMKPQKIEIVPYGLSIAFKITPDDYNMKIKNGNKFEMKKIIVAFAGPLTNLLIVLIASNLLGNNMMVVYSNVLLMIFNLLPVYPLDGGRILKGIFHILFGKKRADKYINTTSFVVLLFLTFVSSIVIYEVENISIFIIIVVLWGIFVREDIDYRKRCKIYDAIERL